MAVVSSEQLKAFFATHYHVHDPRAQFTLRIGEQSAALQRLHRAHEARSSAFLTAWNPLGEVAPPHANAACQSALQHDLDVLGVTGIPGKGIDPATDWAEDSVLALGLSRDQATALGNKYQQLAIVWIGDDAIPELILLQ